MKSKFLVVVLTLMLLVALLPTVEATQPSGPVTIVTEIDFSSFPFSGTFEVTEGDDILGCQNGVFVDIVSGTVQKIFTCESGGEGTFIFRFVPNPAVPGPGEQNGHWQAFKSTGDFVGLRGQGHFSVIFTGTESGIETLTGVVHFEP